MKNSKEFEKGYLSKLKYKDLKDNPYSYHKDREKWKNWSLGWRQAQLDMIATIAEK